MLTLAVLLALALLVRANLQLQSQRTALMALSDEVKALRDEHAAFRDRVLADIRKLHDLLVGADPDVPGALAAIAEIRAHMGEVDAEVDRPEPGDEPPPPPA